MSGVTSASRVGSKKRPGRSLRRSPPATTRAPARDGVARSAPRRVRPAAAKVIAPTSTSACVRSGRRPGPGAGRPSPSGTARRTPRRPAPRPAPARGGCRPGRCWRSAPQTAACAAAGRSASASTMNGDLPPSSSTHGIRRSPQRPATCVPTRLAAGEEDHVGRLDQRLARVARRPASTWNTSVGQALLAPQLRHPQRRQRRDAATASA